MSRAPVFSDAGATIEHAQPVTLDRMGQLPAIFVDDTVSYQVSAYNEFGVFRYQQTFPGPGVAIRFDDLADTPDSKTGEDGRFPTVDESSDRLVYRAPPSEFTGDWFYAADTTMVDPGLGFVRTDDAPVSATSMAISVSGSTGNDFTALFQTLRAGDILYAQTSSGANWARFEITGTPTDNTTWFLIPINRVDGSGTVNTGDNIIIRFSYGVSATSLVPTVQPIKSSSFTIPAPDNTSRTIIVPTDSSSGAFTLTPDSAGWQPGDSLIVVDSPGTSWAVNAVSLDIQGGGHNYHEDGATTISLTGGGIKRYVYVNSTTGFADGIPP
ncbi:hypothetical protein [Microbulbifer celer]|nr:hypothetical protein [Microbulbifer celer]